ncbi:tetratricopeptide repeat protein [Kribbella sp. NPDC048915]|uniref:tetratricopeptide repeat protein n=1 Tax=Kribbella sp. NPDC048915 TaxID=3155148 RepID=UPI0033F75B1D
MSHVAADAVATAALHLMRAGQWAAATELLQSTHPDAPAERSTLALAAAEVAVDRDFAQQTTDAPAALEAVDAVMEGWDVELLKWRNDYGVALFGSREGGPELALRAQRLIEQAPDDRRLGAVHFWAGVLADNLLGRSDEAFIHYTTALELGEKTDDRLLISYALRHLGDHAHTAGDLELARKHWERSTELRQEVGHLLGALAQQTLLAVLLRDEADAAGSKALATEINRWSRQIPVPSLTHQTAHLMASG